MNDYSKGLDNLRRAIRIARKAVCSDRAYSRALADEEEREWYYWCRAQDRILTWRINAENGELLVARRRGA